MIFINLDKSLYWKMIRFDIWISPSSVLLLVLHVVLVSDSFRHLNTAMDSYQLKILLPAMPWIFINLKDRFLNILHAQLRVP